MKVRTSLGLAAAIALMAGWSSFAQAGFTSIQTSITTQGDTATWTDVQNGALAITAPSTDSAAASYDLWGTIDSDPDLTITERITNNSSFDWYFYAITIKPDAGYFVSGLVSNSSNHLGSNSVIDNGDGSFTLSYLSTGPADFVAHGVGEKLIVSFDFTISDEGGTFGYHVFNFPGSGAVPEPASLAMVGLGATLLLRRRRKV